MGSYVRDKNQNIYYSIVYWLCLQLGGPHRPMLAYVSNSKTISHMQEGLKGSEGSTS